MTIASEIARLEGAKADILGAIAEKKVDVPAGAMLADAPDLIRSIKSGINVKIGQGIYPAVKIGNQLWLARNLDEELGTLGVDEWYYNGRSEKTLITYFNNATVTSTYRNVDVYDWNTGVMDGFSSKATNPTASIFARVDVSLAEPVTGKRFEIYVMDGSGVSRLVARYSPNNTETSFTVQGTIGDIPSTIRRFYAQWDSIGGKQVTLTNFRACYGTTDCGANAISVPQALTNEADSKSRGYGRLYVQNNVKNNISKLGLNVWKVPTKQDWTKLADYCGGATIAGKYLKATGPMRGEDTYGFNGLGSGHYSIGDVFYGRNARFRALCSDNYDTYSGASIQLIVDNDIMSFYGINRDKIGCSLRLVMDLNDDGTIPDSNIVIEEPATTAEPLALASEPIVDEEDK